jgi:signal transduction histidine kinase
MNAIIYLLVALGSFLLVLQHRRSFKLYTATGSFVLMCLVAAVGFGSFGLHLIWASTVFHFIYPMMAALLPAALMGFLVRWLEIPEHRADNYLWGLGVGVGLLHLVLKQSLDANDTAIGLPEYLISSWFLGSSAFGLYWLWQLFTHSRDTHRVRLQQLLGLIMIAVISLLVEGWLRLMVPNLQMDDISALQQIATLQGPVPPLGAVLSMLTLYVLHLNVRRTRLVSLQEFFSRLIAHGITALIFTLVVALSLFLGGRYSLHTGFQVWLISLLFVILLPNLTWSIRQVSDHLLNQEGSDLDVIVDELAQQLRHVVNELDFANLLITKIHESSRVQRVSIYFYDGAENFSRHSWLGWGGHPDSIPANTLRTHIQFGDVLKSIPTHSKRHNPEHQSILDTVQADLLFPIWKDDALYGCLTIQNKDRTGGFSNSEIAIIADLLQNTSSQFSTFYVVQQIQDVHRRRGLQSMAHGLVTQLQPKLAHTQQTLQFIQEPTVLPDERNLLVESVTEDLKQLQDLLQAVHSISNPIDFVQMPYSIPEHLKEVVSTHSDQYLRIDLHTTESLPDIQASPEAILQIWPALIHNAKEAQSSALDITLTIGLCQHASRRGQPAVVVTLKDNGSGIPSDILNDVTIPLFTTKEGHTGLGLSLVQHIMDTHNGEMSILSTLDVGTVATLRFPIAR